jgi:hypothetical protein
MRSSAAPRSIESRHDGIYVILACVRRQLLSLGKASVFQGRSGRSVSKSDTKALTRNFEQVEMKRQLSVVLEIVPCLY